jgi:hypothetical protein
MLLRAIESVRFGSSCAYPSAVGAVAQVAVAGPALVEWMALGQKRWFLHLESLLRLGCFHGRFCLGAGVVDLRHDGCQQP